MNHDSDDDGDGDIEDSIFFLIFKVLDTNCTDFLSVRHFTYLLTFVSQNEAVYTIFALFSHDERNVFYFFTNLIFQLFQYYWEYKLLFYKNKKNLKDIL